MKTRIYVVRHAEAEGNLFRRIHGQYESSVTENGMRQIRARQERVAEEAIDACYSSDLIRTRTTAQAVWVPKGLTLRPDPRFREVRLGVWEDVPFGQLEREEPEMMERFSADPWNWHVQGAEDFPVYSRRFLDAMTEAAEQCSGKTIVIFSHGCVIRSMQQRLFFPPEAIREIGHCDNTGVSLLEYEGGVYRKIYLNDNSHLPREISTFSRQNWWRKAGSRADRNLWFRPMEDDPGWYIACRRDAWEAVYGKTALFDGMAYYREARAAALKERWALCEAMLGEERVGLLQLDPDRGAEQGIGYLPFLYLAPGLRGCGLGIQILGQAVSHYRKCGRDRLQLSVSPRNGRALAFYRKYGFTEAGHTPGLTGELIRMEWDLKLDRYLAAGPDMQETKKWPPAAAIL